MTDKKDDKTNVVVGPWGNEPIENKLDIDNFFGNIIHNILFDAWDWILQKWTTSKHARKRYIAIPKYKGRHFMQFCERVEEWRSRQTHPHTRNTLITGCRVQPTSHTHTPGHYMQSPPGVI